jgi:hypothetical protein
VSDNSLVLFSTVACHLCEQALVLLQPWLQQRGEQGVQQREQGGWFLREVDISEADELFQRYGLIIPVLRHDSSGNELNWPFDADSISRFLAANSAEGEN